MEYGKRKLTDDSLKNLQNRYDAGAARGARANAAVENSKGNTEAAKKWTAQADQIDSKTGISTTPTPVRLFVRTGNTLNDMRNQTRIAAGLEPTYDNDYDKQQQKMLDAKQTTNTSSYYYTYKNYLTDSDARLKTIDEEIAALTKELDIQNAYWQAGDYDKYDYQKTVDNGNRIKQLQNEKQRIAVNNAFAKENYDYTLAMLAGDADLIRDYHDYYNVVTTERSKAQPDTDNSWIARIKQATAPEQGTEHARKLDEITRQLKAKGYTDEQLQAFVNVLNTSDMQEFNKAVSEWAKEHPILSTAASVATAPVRGMMGVAGMVFDNGTRNSPFQIANEFASTVQDTVKNDIVTGVTEWGGNVFGDSKVGQFAADKLGKGVGFVYSAAVSSVESYLTMQMGGALGELLMGMNAASSTYNEALNNGLSNFQAMTTAMTSGVFEAVFEHLSLENLRGLKASDGRGMKTLIGNVVKSFITEGSEEVATDLANELWDYFTNGGLSEYERYVANYMDENTGATREQAEAAYRKKFLKQLGESMIVGGLSGAMHAGVYGARNEIRGAGLDVRTGKALETMGKEAEGGVREVLSPLTEQMRATAEAELPENATRKQKQQQKQAEKQAEKLEWRIGLYEQGKKTRSRLGYDVNRAMENLSEKQVKTMTEALQEATDMDKNTAAQYARDYAEVILGERGSAEQLANVVKNVDALGVLEELAGRDNAKTIEALRTTILQRASEHKLSTKAYDKYNKWVHRDEIKKAEKQGEINEKAESIVKDHKAGDYVDAMYEGKTESGKVTVGAIKGVDDGKVTVVVDKSGATDSLDNVTFDEERTAEIYNTARDMMTGAAEYGVKMSVDGANLMLAGVQNNTTNLSAKQFMNEFYEAYKAGSVMREFGRFTDETNVGLDYATLQTAYAAGAANYNLKPGVTRIGNRRLSNLQVKELAIFDRIFSERGISMIVTDELMGEMTDEEGKTQKVRLYGEYIDTRKRLKGKDAIVVALGTDGQAGGNVLSVTAYHELFHWMGKQGKEAKAMQQFLQDSVIDYVKGREDLDYEAMRQQRLDAGYTEAEVDEEIAAQFFGTAMAERGWREEQAAKDPGLWQKIIDHVKAFLAEIRDAIEKWAGNDMAVQAAMKTEIEDLDRFCDMFQATLDSITEGRQNESSQQNEVIEDGVVINTEGDFAAPDYSMATWNESDYVKQRDKMIEKIVEKVGVSRRKAAKWVDSINSVAALIANDREALDYDQEYVEGKTALKKNSEYKWTLDFSTLCAKRLLFTGTFDEIQKALPEHAFSSEELLELRKMMMDRGYQVACGICYVESTRREMGPITEEFIRRYKEAQKTGDPIKRINSEGKEVALRRKVKKGVYEDLYTEDGYTPTLGNLNTTDIDKVRIEHPDVYDAYIAFMNARGQAKPKLLETRTAYKGEILRTFADKRTVKARNDAGGLRIQSFSDFEIVHLIDMMQVVMDMSVVGLRGQAYTKVPAFAEALGNTGMKINLSLIAKGTGLDADGNLIFDSVEGMDAETAFKLRDRFSENVGTILVGANDAHILAAMADDRIDFIIPFHKSSWRADLYDLLGIRGYDDYTDSQNEKWLNKNGEESKRKCKNLDPMSYWDFSKSGDENAEIYLDLCEKQGRRPKFPQFAYDENGNIRHGYWKLLIDFKMYDNDGKGAKQKPVQPIFDDEVTQRLMEEYKKESPGAHRQFPVAQDVVDDFVKTTRSREMGRQIEGLTGGVKVNYSMAGIGSRTADKSLLRQAKKMERNGDESEKIRKKTGWFKGYDGKWRYEIDDSKIEIDYDLLETKDTHKLTDVIKHDDLFKAYPELKKITVKVSNDLESAASYDYNNNVVNLHKVVIQAKYRTKSALIHELQHAIQYIEGFTFGTSPEYMKWFANEMLPAEKEVNSREEKRIDKFLKGIKKKNNTAYNLLRAYIEVETEYYNSFYDNKGHIPKSEYKEFTNAFKEARADLETAGYKDILEEYRDISKEYYHNLNLYHQRMLFNPNQAYMHLAGEVEARDAGTRAELTAEQRKEKRPDIDRKDVFFVNVKQSRVLDSAGRELTEGQQEFFEDSKVRDAEGRLQVVYHGTTAYDRFNTFKRGKGGWLGPGSYFTVDKRYAQRYAKAMGDDGQLYETYLNITNPIVCNSDDPAKEILRAIYGSDTVYNRRSQKQASLTSLITSADIKKAKEKGYDGVVWTKGVTEYAAWEPAQIKEVSNKNPSWNPDIRYSRLLNNSALDYADRLRQTSRQYWEMLDILEDMAGGSQYHNPLDDLLDESNLPEAERQRLSDQTLQRIARKYIYQKLGKKTGKATPEQVRELAEKLKKADAVLAGAKENIDVVVYGLYKIFKKDMQDAGHYDETELWVREFRNEFRDEDGKKVKVYIPANVRTDVTEDYGGPNGFRKAMFGMMDITYDDHAGGIDLKKFYSNLRGETEDGPGANVYDLPDTDNPSDMINNIVRWYNTDPYSYTPETDGSRIFGMTLEEAATRKAIEAAMDMIVADKRLSKTDRQNVKRLKELGAELDAENLRVTEEVIDQREKEMKKEMEKLRKKEMDLVTLEVEQEKIRSDYWIENLRKYVRQIRHQLEEENYALKDEMQLEREEAAEREYNLRKDLKEQHKLEMDALRQVQEQKIQELKDRQAENAKKQVLRNSIKRNMKAVTDVFTNSKKNKFLPEEMQADILSFVHFFDNDRNVLTENTVRRLKNISDAIINEESGYERLFDRFDANVAQDLANLLKELDDEEDKFMKKHDGQRMKLTLTGRMSVEQLDVLNEIIDHIRFLIDTTNEMEVNGRRVKLDAKAEQFKQQMQEKVRSRLAKAMQNTFADDILNGKMLTPIYMFKEKIGGVAGELYDDIRLAQDDWMRTVKEGAQKLNELREKYHYDEWKKRDSYKQKFHYEGTLSRDTWDVEMDAETRMSIYALYKRQATNQQESNHLNKGGIVIEDEQKRKHIKERLAVLLKGKSKRAAAIKALENELNASRHMLFYDELEAIANSLDQDQKDYVDEMVKYMSTDLSAKGNETSRKLTGIAKFHEAYYFPFRSVDSYLHTRFGESVDSQLKNMGFTKETQEGADTPLMVTPFTVTAARHIEEMARYAAFAVPIDNFQRLYNYEYAWQDVDEEGNIRKIKEKDNVKTLLTNTFGKGVNDYIQTFMQDLNGGIRKDDTDSVLGKGTAWFKRAAVAGNVSVVIQQPTALMRAMAMINPRYFIGWNTTDSSSFKQFFTADYKDMMEHSMVANVKEMGGFDTGLGVSAVDWMVDDPGVVQRVSDILTKPAAFADSITWTNIWNAVKREVRHDHPDVEYASDEYYKLVDDRFRDVVDYTQVYDSTLSKNEFMRSKSGLAKMITAFMAEPSLSYNLITQSGKRNGRSISKAAALGAFAANIIVNSMFKTLIGAARDKDDEETLLEIWSRRFAAELVGSWEQEVNGEKRKIYFLDGSWDPLTMIPVVKDILSLLEGYDVARSDTSVFADLIDATMDFKAEWKDENGVHKAPDYKAWLNWIGALSNMTTVPLGRAIKDIFSVVNRIQTYAQRESAGDHFTTTGQTWWRAVNEGLGFEVGDAEKAYNAVVNNDTETLKRLLHANEAKLGKVEAKGYTGENITAQAEVELQKNLNSLLSEGLTEFDPEQRVQAAAQARYDRNYALYDELVDSMVDDGFDRNVVLAATEKAWQALHPTEEKKVDEIKDKNAYLYADLTEAIRANDAKGVQYVKDKLLQQGSDQENVEKKVRETVDDMLVEGEIKEEDAQRMLVNYAGLSEKEAEAEVDYRIYAGNSAAPDLDKDDWHMYTKTIDGQEYSIRDKGIEPEVFSTYRTESAKCTADVDASGKTISGSKKVKVMAVIDGLPITKEQKDALYFLNGWSKNTLYEAPWH